MDPIVVQPVTVCVGVAMLRLNASIIPANTIVSQSVVLTMYAMRMIVLVHQQKDSKLLLSSLLQPALCHWFVLFI